MAQPARASSAPLDRLLALCYRIAAKSPTHLNALLVIVQLVADALDG